MRKPPESWESRVNSRFLASSPENVSACPVRHSAAFKASHVPVGHGSLKKTVGTQQAACFRALRRAVFQQQAAAGRKRTGRCLDDSLKVGQPTGRRK